MEPSLLLLPWISRRYTTQDIHFSIRDYLYYLLLLPNQMTGPNTDLFTRVNLFLGIIKSYK